MIDLKSIERAILELYLTRRGPVQQIAHDMRLTERSVRKILETFLRVAQSDLGLNDDERT